MRLCLYRATRRRVIAALLTTGSGAAADSILVVRVSTTALQLLNKRNVGKLRAL